MLLLKLYRRQLVVETMPALWVVKHLDVVEDSSTSILPGAVDFSSDSLPFQQLEKAFRHRVVMAVTTPTHAAKQVIGFQEALLVTAAELATLVGVNHHFLPWLSAPNGHQLGINSQVAGHLRLH